MVDIPQTGRQPIAMSDEAINKTLKKRHPQDAVDYFATDPNTEIRTLGRLAVRRSDINDLFALGDLCAKRSITEDGRLLVFYVGKTLIAYQKAHKTAEMAEDRDLAWGAILSFTDWLIAAARENTSRRNVAVALWAIGEHESEKDTDRTVADLDMPGEKAGYEEVIPELLDIYLNESPTGPVQAQIEAPEIADDGAEEHTVVASFDASGTISDFSQTVADIEVSDSLLSPEADFTAPSETRMEHTAMDLFTSMERDASHADRKVPTAPVSIPVHSTTENEFAVGDWIQDRYEVHDVRRGGMGVVYLCYDHQNKEPVAIKTFQSRFLENERAVARFNQEATTWILLEKHRYIVQARRVETIQDRPHIILEHISGPEGLGSDLRSWIDHNRLDLPQSIEFGLHIALGMQHASQRVEGLVHRDLKPANVLVTHDGIAKITDFGLVRSLEFSDIPLPGNEIPIHQHSRSDPSNRLTRFGAIVGTAPYMSPEQCESKDVDIRSDIYAFGCMLYEMLTSRHVFQVKKFNAWKQAHLKEKPHFDTPYDVQLPMQLQNLVLACLEKKPADRPATWAVVVEELAAIYENVTGNKATLEIAGPAMEVHELIDKGYSLTELSRMDEALEAYDRAIALQEENALAWARKGRALRLMGRFDDALICYDRALEIFPRYAFAWRGKGLVLERLGRMEQALACYEMAAQIKPNDVWNWYNQADVLQNLNRYDDAIPLLEKALEVDPSHPNSWAKLGQIYRLQQIYDKAINAYEKAIEMDPGYAWAHNGRGLVLKILGQHDEAIASFKRATQYQPEEVWHWYNLTEMLVEVGQYSDAVAPATQATKADPTHAFSWAKLGQVLRYMNRNEEALDAYDRAIALQPDYSWAINGKGIVLEHIGRLEEALEAYQQAAQYADSYIWHCWYNQGNVLVLLGRHKEALPLLERVTKIVPQHAPSWARMGNALRHMKKFDEALNAYRHATRLDPNYAWAWNEQGITLETLGRLDEALKSYKRASQSAPKDAYYIYQQADVLIQLGQYQQGLEFLEQALKLESGNARTWAKHGQVLRRLGRFEEALRSYTRAVELDEYYGWAWNGRGLTLSALGRHEEALICFRKATVSDEQDVWYWYNTGDELVILNRFEEALKVLDQAIKLNTRHPESWAKRGQALRRLGMNAEALVAYDQALSLNPRYAWAWNGRGLVLESLGRREEALASYERSTEEDPKVIWYFTNQIDVLLDMQRKSEALGVADRAIALMPKNPVGYARRGQVLRRLGNHESAIESYQKALELDDTYAWAWNGEGLAFAALGKYDEAISCYELAVYYNENDLYFWNNFGDSLMAVKDYAKAVEAYHQALALDPTHETTQQKLKQAQDLLEKED